MGDSSSLDPYRPPEAVHAPERHPDDPEWVGKPSTCKACKQEFVVENRFRRYTCPDCDGKSSIRGWLIFAGLFVLWILVQAGYFVAAILAG
ncbi:MAG: hypothetical protein R3F62_22030 [Planctomycetota bacterium]